MFNKRQKILILIMIVIIILACIMLWINLRECKENMAIVETSEPTDDLIESSVEPSSDVEIIPNIENTSEPEVSEEAILEEEVESESTEGTPNVAITIEPIPDINVEVEYIEIEDLLD